MATIEASNGSAATPGFTFTSETSTGLYRKSAGVVGLSLLGTGLYEFNDDSLVAPFQASFAGAAQRGAQGLSSKLEDWASVKDFGAVGDGTANDTAAINAAINWLNAAPFRVLFFPRGWYRIESIINPITQDDVTVLGYGARLLAVGDGRVWRVGATGLNNGADRVRIVGFEYQFSGTISDTHFLLDLIQTVDSEFSDFTIINAAGLLRYGGDASEHDQCTGIMFRNWIGNFNSGATSAANILIRNGTSAHFLDWHFSGPGGGNSGTKAILKIQPAAVAPFLDTFWFMHCSFQAFDSEEGEGKAYGVYIDRTNADITNLWFIGCVFDHTTTAGFYFKGGGDALETPFDRNINILFCRFATDAGKGIVIDFDTTPTQGLRVRGLTVLGNKIILTEGGTGGSRKPGIEVRGIDAIKGLDCSHNAIMTDTTSAKDCGIFLNCGDFTAIANWVGSGTNAASGFETAIRVDHVDADNFIIDGNVCGADVAALVIEPTYSAESPYRRIQGRRPTCASTSNRALLAKESGALFTNGSASGEVNFTLPPAKAGLQFSFHAAAAQTLRVTAGSGDTIRIDGSLTSTGNVASTAVGNSVTLVAHDDANWASLAREGSGTVT